MKRLPKLWINPIPSIKLIILSVFMGFYLILSLLSLGSISLDPTESPSIKSEVNLSECNCKDETRREHFDADVLP